MASMIKTVLGYRITARQEPKPVRGHRNRVSSHQTDRTVQDVAFEHLA